VKLHFEIVRAGVWQATERTDIQLRKMPRTTIGRNGIALPGWAVFVGPREMLTCGREATKRHAAENAQAYVEREAEAAAAAEQARRDEALHAEANRTRERDAGETLALLGLTAATHMVKMGGTVVPREGIPCAHPEAARVKSRDVWHPDTCGGCGEPVPDADATPTLGPARPEAPAPIREALERVTRAAYEAVEAAIEATRTPRAVDPTTEDDVPELVERIVRRAQFEALRTVLDVLDGWIDGAAENHEAMSHRDNDCCRDFAPADIRRMVNGAAAELRVPEPYRAEVTP
jgi:hypothetical protein